jgi:agmatinase
MDDLKKFKNFLCPPGEGVYTVHTAKKYKNLIHQHLFGCTDSLQVADKWKKSLTLTPKKTVLFGICSDTGGGIQRGANWGPLFIRNRMSELKVHDNFYDLGDIRVIPHLLHDKYLNNETIVECQKALYEGEKLPVSPLSITEEVTSILLENDNKFLALGGDHSVSYPLVKKWIQHKKSQGKKVAIIHFDAHTDLLDKRLGIDICFGSWAYHILEDLESRDLLIQLGIRSSGKDRGHWENTLGVKQYWTDEIQDRGITEIASEINKHLKSKGVDELYISFDIDAIDSEYVSATGTPEGNGLYPHEAVGLIKLIGEKNSITAADLVEVAPFVSMSSNSFTTESTVNVAVNIIEAIEELLST